MLVLWLLKLILQARTETHSVSVQPVVVIIAATCSPRACVCYVRLRHSQRHGFALPARCPIHNSVMDAALHSPPSATLRLTMGVLGKRAEWAWDRIAHPLGSSYWAEEKGNKGRFGGLQAESYSERGSRRGSMVGFFVVPSFLLAEWVSFSKRRGRVLGANSPNEAADDDDSIIRATRTRTIAAKCVPPMPAPLLSGLEIPC